MVLILKNSGSFLLYIVSASRKKLVSQISEGQKNLLERLDLGLEAD